MADVEGFPKDLQAVVKRIPMLAELPKELRTAASVYIQADTDRAEGRRDAFNAARGQTGGLGRAAYENYAVVAVLRAVQEMQASGAKDSEIAKKLQEQGKIITDAGKEFAEIARDAKKQYEADVRVKGKALKNLGIDLSTLDEKLKEGDELILDEQEHVQAYLGAQLCFPREPNNQTA